MVDFRSQGAPQGGGNGAADGAGGAANSTANHLGVLCIEVRRSGRRVRAP